MNERITQTALPNELKRDNEVLYALDLNTIITILKGGVNANKADLDAIVAGQSEDVIVKYSVDALSGVYADTGTIAYVFDIDDERKLKAYERLDTSWRFVEEISLASMYTRLKETKVYAEGVQAEIDKLFSILDGSTNDIFVEFDTSNAVSNFLQERGVFKENDLIDHVRVVFPNYIPPESSVTCNISAVGVQTFTNVVMTRNSDNEYGLFLTGAHTAEAAPLVFTVTVDDGISSVVYENFTVMVESTGFNFLQNQLDDKLDKETLLDQTVKGRVFFEKGIEVIGEDSGNKIVLSGDAMSGNFVFSAGTSWD